MTTIAVFGSAFNPPSLGHKSVIDSLMHFDRVLLVPSIAHAWGKSMLDFDVRCRMIEGFIDEIGQEKVQLSRIEEALYQPDGVEDNRSVTTFDVLGALQQRYPDAVLTFVLGPDNLMNFSKFYKADEIVQRWSVLACPEKLAIRSSDIRQRCINNQTIAEFTTPSVQRYIQQKKLYIQQ
ncbi:nicotinate-nicotinamide nucleotide adenylyltransferase [Vibrio algicola]|uniref:nicotinate-nucleotide adenylyltransferase n=1 Tax=Vibrio algicola TaxID=2662262 RepID=A0A5Q0TIE2_9VIBR|nr:nicotinate-nicotinamide nucleotide adenylyltransferase [Vibrio algicola]